MSSITFPHGEHGHPRSTSSSTHEGFYANGFEAAGNGSFQMNPLSSHPPRTPRTSVVASGHVYGEDIYPPKEEEEDNAEKDSVDEEHEKEANEAGGNARIRKEEIWRELIKTSYGRDKTFKIIQYSMRLYLLFHTTLTGSGLAKNSKRRPWEAVVAKRLDSAISGFSLTRKCLILFNWLGPLTEILAQHASDDSFGSGSSPAKHKRKPLLHTFLHASPPTLLDLFSGISDDIYTFSRLGLIGKSAGERAGYYADWFWFLTTLVNLVENGVERSVILDQQHQVESRLYSESMSGATSKSNPTASRLDGKELARLQRQDQWILMSRWKLTMDLIFVSYNVFNLKKAKSSVQTFAGLTAALLSTAKVYDRHRNELIKAKKF